MVKFRYHVPDILPSTGGTPLSTMKIFLVQHGLANPKEEDPHRGLSSKGMEDVEKMARFVGQMDHQYEAIFHSGKKRAEQTAQILGKHLKHALGVHESDFLGPNDDIEVWVNRLLCSDGDPVVVGHLPFLDRLASRLVAQDENRQVLSFRNGGVACLEDSDENFAVRWALTPDMIN